MATLDPAQVKAHVGPLGGGVRDLIGYNDQWSEWLPDGTRLNMWQRDMVAIHLRLADDSEWVGLYHRLPDADGDPVLYASYRQTVQREWAVPPLVTS